MMTYYVEQGGTHTPVRQELIRNIVQDEQPEGHIDIWRCRRKHDFKEHRKSVYNRMLMDGSIIKHLININEEAKDIIAYGHIFVDDPDFI